jgi:hypothetical protein
MARDQGSNMQNAVNWVTRNNKRMVRKRPLERWEIKLENCEDEPKAIWRIARSLTKRGGPKTPAAIHSLLGPIFHPKDKAHIIGDGLENQFRAHDLCNYDHRRHMEAKIEAPLATVDEDIPVNFQPYDV